MSVEHRGKRAYIPRLLVAYHDGCQVFSARVTTPTDLEVALGCYRALRLPLASSRHWTLARI